MLSFTWIMTRDIERIRARFDPPSQAQFFTLARRDLSKVAARFFVLMSRSRPRVSIGIPKPQTGKPSLRRSVTRLWWCRFEAAGQSFFGGIFPTVLTPFARRAHDPPQSSPSCERLAKPHHFGSGE